MSKEEKKYSVTLEVNEKVFKATGATIEEALDKIDPKKFLTIGKLVISRGNKKVEAFLGIFKMKKLFTDNKILKTKNLFKELYLKNIKRAFE